MNGLTNDRVGSVWQFPGPGRAGPGRAVRAEAAQGAKRRRFGGRVRTGACRWYAGRGRPDESLADDVHDGP